ncbi:MAG: protein kinase, partial [Chitinivibrionales bacterium]|nr:protein kinase [Chitinivibrionales bacterium]
ALPASAINGIVVSPPMRLHTRPEPRMSQEPGRAINDRLRKALEKTVPSSEFSVHGTRKELDRTPVAETPSTGAQQYLLKTKTDPSNTPSMDDSSPVVGFSTTSLVPPELLDQEEQEGPRFDVTGEAGHGGTAHVYTVVDRSLGRTIALKLLRGRAQKKKGVKQRFIHEARVTAMLEHPNIVPVYDIGVTEDNRVYFLMKNVSGVSVGGAIRAAREGREVPEEFRTIDGRLRLVLKVCDALAFAHDKGFIHQDIKPDNIMLGSFGEVLVLDWGCAIGEKERAGGKAATYGTPAYMSPEQARQAGADERSDVYCLGATLYHMLTLCHPTWSDDPNEFWEMKRQGTLSTLPRGVRDAVPEALLELVRTAMAPDPAERFQSVAAFQHAIVEYQEHAESIALAHRAAEQLKAVGEQGEYHEYARITARFEQALEMWRDNRDAVEGLIGVRRGHALRALERGDLELAASITGGADELVDVHERIEAERTRRRRMQIRARRTLYAAGTLGVLLLVVFGYYLVDYFRYFGKWQRLCHVDFTSEQVDLDKVIFSHSWITREEEPEELTDGGLLLRSSRMFWARDVRERGDVRVEVVVRWPYHIDGLEIMLNARREQGEVFSMCPTGYACQFGGWRGAVNIISRNTRPGWPNQGNSVGCDLEPEQRYRLWFQRVGEELSLFVDGRRVFHAVEPLPLAGEGLEWVGVRCWADLIVESFTVWRMGAPRKTSPVIAGDIQVQRGKHRDAAEVYLRVAQDHPGTSLEEQALSRAYLAASQVSDADSLKASIREKLRGSHPHSPYWSLLLQADCLTAWRDGRYGRALELGAETLERAPDSRVALRMIAGRPDSLPLEALDGALRLLSRSTKVYGVSLDETGVRDISPLRGLPIRSLALRSNDVSDLSPLRGMPLRLLLISDNPVSDLSPLQGMKLTTLDADNCDITDIGPLAGMPLQSLTLGNNRIRDIGPLAGMPLSFLHLGNNGIEAILPLRGMESLRELRLGDNPITDIEPLRGLNLRTLYLKKTGVSDLTPLTGMPLRDLSLESTDVTDLTPLRDAPLNSLNVAGSAVRSLQPLNGMPLERLHFHACGIRDLSPLRGMRLREIHCRRNRIRDIDVLRGMPLSKALLSENEVSDLSPLAGAPLRELDVRGNPLASLAPFEQEPPQWMVFDTVTAGSEYAGAVLSRWERSGDTVAERLSSAAIAYRRKDAHALRELAISLDGHRYLHVPVQQRFDRAREIADSLGGHLVTVTSQDELRLVGQCLNRDVGVWLDLEPVANPARWLTGEPLTIDVFADRFHRHTAMPRYMLKGYGGEMVWFALTDTLGESDLLIEWEPSD